MSATDDRCLEAIDVIYRQWKKAADSIEQALAYSANPYDGGANWEIKAAHAGLERQAYRRIGEAIQEGFPSDLSESERGAHLWTHFCTTNEEATAFALGHCDLEYDCDD